MSAPAFPPWLHWLSAASLALAAACALIIVLDLVRRPQAMWIMNLVWPLTALFGSVLWLAGYWRWGRAPPRGAKDRGAQPPFWVMTAKAASHCGAGCTLGDLIAEGLAMTAPALVVACGWGSLFHEKTFAVWILDFVLAFALGLAFQYFTLQPMRDLPPAKALFQALKADTASITAWQVGMYGAMAAIQFGLLKPAFGAIAPAGGPEFWFAMQIAMLAGFAVSYPVNWLLLKAGIKEPM